MRMARTLTILLPLLAAALFFTSCIKEDEKDCSRYISRIKVVDADLNDITNTGVVRSIALYLFDSNGFVREIETNELAPVFLGDNITEPFTLVAWGNKNADSLQIPQLLPGASLKESWMQARTQTNELLQPLNDLFYGRQMFPKAAARNEKDIYIVLKRCIAGLSVRTIHLAEQFGQSAEPHSIKVRGAANAINFLGDYASSTTAYEPLLITDAQNDLYAPLFRIFPADTEQAIEIDIFRGTGKLVTLKTDNKGNLLRPITGKHTEIVIDFNKSLEVAVSVSVLNWEQQTNQETEM